MNNEIPKFTFSINYQTSKRIQIIKAIWQEESVARILYRLIKEKAEELSQQK
jgi:hypothetical protein